MKDRFVVIRHPEVCFRLSSQISSQWRKSEKLRRCEKMMRIEKDGRGYGTSFTAVPLYVTY
jgi:hypothetical protein